uniref:SEFIR domain-containing protein n=1 Tax=Anabas testudineus TaxID=64144 RepID=A0A3Q1IPJ3_ANATE
MRARHSGLKLGEHFPTIGASCSVKMRTALALLAVLASQLLLGCTKTTCQVNHVQGLCPVKLTSVQYEEYGRLYAECVTLHVWMTADDLCKAPKIEILSPEQDIIRPVMKKMKKVRHFPTAPAPRLSICMNCHDAFTVIDDWLEHGCIIAGVQDVVSVSYSTASTSCNLSYTVRDPIPAFDVFVNQSSKSITVTVESGKKVYARLCYKKNEFLCSGVPESPLVTIDPSRSQSAHFNITYLLPCVCVEVYYTHTDAMRNKKCPFQKERVADVRDVWLTSEVELYESSLHWITKCPANDLPEKISASLCWKQHEHLCTPVLGSTLEENDDGKNLTYNTSAVDRHPQMCVQFSLQGSQNIQCPFQADMSSWEAHIGPGRQSVIVYLTSLVPAMFSAQFCVLNKTGCSPIGPVHALRTEGTQMNMLPHFTTERPCVQVWQSDPALHGKRILCPDYTHNRYGMYAAALLIFVVMVALLGIFIHRLTRSGAAGWLYIQKPVLLVCSSELSSHVSSVCALASILQGELSATVHMALWAQSSQRQTGGGTGVADLGPLPWLYGQWELVQKAQGKVLIIWSPEAKEAYEKWREERVSLHTSGRKKEDDIRSELKHERIKVDAEADYKLNGRLGKYIKEKATGKKDCSKLCNDKDWCQQKMHSTVTGPVFAAALACLEGALQQSKGQGVAIVYFQGLGHSRDIPKAFRGVPRYCVPQDFRGLIQELGGMRRPTQTGKFTWHCWPRLLSKVLSIWLARKLAKRLQRLLPQTQGKKTQELKVTSSQKIKTQSRLKLLLEQEPLHEVSKRAEKL